MPKIVTATEFHARDGLADWRFLLGRIEATYLAGSYDAAARFALAVAELADRAGHHPDIDIRYPGLVHVAATTHAVGTLTELDLDLATAISGLAADAHLRTEPTSSQAFEVAIDALDIDAVRPFWMALLGYVAERGAPDAQVVAIVDPRRFGPAVWFQQMDAPRPQRNRIHIDITVPHDVADERVAAALAAGGTMVSDAHARAFWVLADPEGNEACVCTWQDRD